MAEWWEFNEESIYLAAAVSAVTAMVWPPFHDLSRWLLDLIKAKAKG